MRATAGQNSEAAAVYRDVGIPLVEGLMAFHRGAYQQAAALLHPVRYELWRVGGSNAQRDIVDWTLTEAAVRGGLRDVAVALSNESDGRPSAQRGEPAVPPPRRTDRRLIRWLTSAVLPRSAAHGRIGHARPWMARQVIEHLEPRKLLGCINMPLEASVSKGRSACRRRDR